MKTKNLFFAALFFAALTFGFVGCENPNDNIDNIDNDVKYRLEVNSNNAEMGTVVGSGTFKKGTEVTITAKPNYLYHLCAWSDCDTKDLIRKIVVNSDTVITAIFSDNPYLRVKSNNTSYGTVSGTGTYEIGSEVIITAKPKENYYFFSWSDCDSKELTRTVVVNTDSTIIANFAKKPHLVAKPNNANYGTVTGSGYYDVGTKVTITAATKGEHCYFNGWSDCNSKELTREVVITSDTTIIANFTADPDPYLNVESNNTSFGTVTGSGTYDHGAEATITATPQENYYFTSWSDGNTENPRTVVVNSDTTFTANFTLKPYLTVKSNNTSYGTVTGSGYYMPGDEATITATSGRGVVFKEWNDENTDNPRVVTVTSDMTYTATFVGVPNGSENGYEWVDLGLPSGLKWATCNVGATKPEEYGDYYAWGETEPKTIYRESTYKWRKYNGTIEAYTKYNTSSDYGTVDNKKVLELADDAARANWGGAWRMPIYAEWTELLENCTWTWTSDYNGTGVAGRIVTSNINGNSIFLPAAGYRSDGDLYGAGIGSYWSSSLDGYYPFRAYYVQFYSDYVGWNSSVRYCGQSVRPVLGE